MNIGVIGVGKLGLAFALAFERAGHHVFASSYKQSYVQDLVTKKFRTAEPEIQDMLDRAKNIVFSTNNHDVISNCDIMYVMVATPSLDRGDYDMSAVWAVAEDLKNHPGDVNGKILVIGCTTNPGTCLDLQRFLDHREITVVYSPTFAAQGSVMSDITGPHPVMLGTQDPVVAQTCKRMFADIVPHNTEFKMMSSTAAEMVKLAGNCGSTLLISFYNMVGQTLIQSGLEKDLAVATDFLFHGMKQDMRWKFGFGFGGPCYPRDNRSFVYYADKIGSSYSLGELVDDFNQNHVEFITRYLMAKNQENFAFYFDYVSYKKGVAMFDESHQLKVCKKLLAQLHPVYINPSEFLPDDMRQSLIDEFGDLVKFKTLAEINEAGVPVYVVDFGRMVP